MEEKEPLWIPASTMSWWIPHHRGYSELLKLTKYQCQPLKDFEFYQHDLFSQTLYHKHTATDLFSMMKYSSDHSSLSEFCSGVPVISSRWFVRNSISVRYKRESSFLRRWASSTASSAHATLPRNSLSLRRISYVVRMALNLSFLLAWHHSYSRIYSIVYKYNDRKRKYNFMAWIYTWSDFFL